MPELRFSINDELYLRDPQSTTFGKTILKNSIELMFELGFEAFTFKKLAIRMSSAEASVYRYFENKHKLLLFLTNWYWEWVLYSLQINTLNLENPEKKLEVVIHNIVNASIENVYTDYINENRLHQLIIQESTKAYHITNIDEENDLGFFLSYKKLVEHISTVILELNPNFLYPTSLASNLIEMANNQTYFAEHLPRLTDIKNDETKNEQIKHMLLFFTKKMVSPN